MDDIDYDRAIDYLESFTQYGPLEAFTLMRGDQVSAAELAELFLNAKTVPIRQEGFSDEFDFDTFESRPTEDPMEKFDSKAIVEDQTDSTNKTEPFKEDNFDSKESFSDTPVDDRAMVLAATFFPQQKKESIPKNEPRSGSLYRIYSQPRESKHVQIASKVNVIGGQDVPVKDVSNKGSESKNTFIKVNEDSNDSHATVNEADVEKDALFVHGMDGEWIPGRDIDLYIYGSEKPILKYEQRSWTIVTDNAKLVNEMKTPCKVDVMLTKDDVKDLSDAYNNGHAYSMILPVDRAFAAKVEAMQLKPLDKRVVYLLWRFKNNFVRNNGTVTLHVNEYI